MRNTIKTVANAPVAIVTGASSGIGEATAKRLAQAGFAVVVAARRLDLLQQLADEINHQGGEALAIEVDLADATETSALVSQTLAHYGRVDVLVNNAGYGPPFALEQMDRAKLRHAFDVNLLSAMQLIAELIPVWRKQGGGRVINMSSLTRYVSAPVASSYAATKGGMESMTDCLRIELAPWKISLSLIIPGFVDTPTFDKSRAVGKSVRESPNNPYREWMERLDAFATSQENQAITPEKVAEAVFKAATVAKPATHYFVPYSSYLAAKIFRILPTRLVDSLLAKMYRWGT